MAYSPAESPMPLEDALILLNKTPPFSFLDGSVLAKVAEEIVEEAYPKGQTIHHQSGPAPEHLSIIRSGAVKVFVRTNEGEEVLVDYRTSGEFFGLLSFACGVTARDTIVAVEDTSCGLITKETVLRLMKTNAQFSEFCFRTRLKRLADMTYREIRDRTLLYGGGDKLLFTNILDDLATKEVITASEDISVQEAAEIMSDRNISSLVLLDASGFPSGMVTDRDLRNKVVARGRDITGRVGDIMSVTVIKSEARDYCFEALLKMMRYRIHHLLVVDKGQMKGIITNHDLMMLQGRSPLSVAREIESQDTIDGLAPASQKIDKIVTLLIREGANAGHITRIMTEINDRLLKKVLEITETKLGPPPLGYCWIVFGSEGRKEQTFRTDQDNAIIYEDPKDNGAEAEEYFAEFGVQMRDALAKCGVPPCSADYMASNPLWRQPLAVWKKYFSDWVNSPTPEAILRSLIFFDFRPVHGNVLLAEQLRSFLVHEIKGSGFFLGHMAGTVLRNRPPLDFMGRVRGEKKGPHRGKFNSKVNGLCPIIDIARLSGLELGGYHTSTLARLAELRDRDSTAGDFSRELEQAFEFLMSLRLKHQFQQIQAGAEPDNFIDPRRLSNIERTLLKETFRLIVSAQDAMRKKYAAWSEQ
jgi:CBS domain-containing protein